jgi:hypothetical protein
LDVYLKKIFYKGIVVPDLIGFKSDVVKEVWLRREPKEIFNFFYCFDDF